MAKRKHETAGVGAVMDEYLIALAWSGDRHAVGRLAARWHPRLLRTARRLLGDKELAQAAVQESWVAILRGLGRLRDPARFPAWAFGILRRKCADRIRVRQRERDRTAVLDDNQAVTAAAADDQVAILQAFSRLPADQRLAAHLFYREGLSVAEIADVSGAPKGTVKSRLFHARRKLKAAFTDSQGDEQ